MKRFLYILSCILFGSLSLQAQVITTVAGNGTYGYFGDTGPAIAAEISYPMEIATDTFGNLYISDENNYRIRKVNPAGTITTIAGTGVCGHSGDGGPATAAALSPIGLATDISGNIYVADTSGCVRKINAAGIITTIAGIGISGYSGDGGPATAARLNGLSFLTVDSAGAIYLSEYQDHRIRKIDTAGIITTIAGTGSHGYSGDGIPATMALLHNPYMVALDHAGNVYFADQLNNRIRKIDKAGTITTVAGNGSGGYSGDGSTATAAELNNPQGLFIDATGNMYIGELGNHRVRKVNTAGIISTIAGNGFGGYGGDGGCATAAALYQGAGLAMNKKGDLYISDLSKLRVRMIIHDRAPVFRAGRSQILAFCEKTIIVPVDSLLAVIDSDAGKTDMWDVLTTPVHGTLMATYATTSTGGLLTPAGLSYSPATGYTGRDTFTVVVTDCGGLSDTTTVYVRIDTARPIVSAITGSDTVCIGVPVTLTDTAAGGVWSSSNASAGILGGVVAGVVTGADTISYMVINGCGSDSAEHVVEVKDCKEGTSPRPSPPIAIGVERVSVYPNPNTGEFAVNVLEDVDVEARVVITNIVGEEVKTFVMATNKPVSVRLAQPAGVYFLSVVSAGGKYVMKVMVESR